MIACVVSDAYMYFAMRVDICLLHYERRTAKKFIHSKIRDRAFFIYEYNVSDLSQ